VKLDDAPLERVRAAKNPGWKHGTRKRPNPEKRAKAARVRAARHGKRRNKALALAALYAKHMADAIKGVSRVHSS